MSDAPTVRATSGSLEGTFRLDFRAKRWSSDRAFEEGAFPFVAEFEGKRYELYSDETFDEEPISS